MFYVVLGWYAYRYLELSRRIALAGFTCVLAALAAKAMAIIVTHDYAMWIESPDDPLIAAWSLLIFLAAKRWLPRLPFGRGAQVVAQASFGIYLVHPVFTNFGYKVLGLSPVGFPPLLFELGFWTVAFSGSLAITVGLKRLPLFKEIL